MAPRKPRPSKARRNEEPSTRRDRGQGRAATGSRPPRKAAPKVGSRANPSGNTATTGKPGTRAGVRTGARGALGGTQVEGRQAVRELLLAGRRKVREIYMVEGLDPAPILEDIRDLARENRVSLHEVSRKQLDRMALTEGSQGVVGIAEALPEVSLATLTERALTSKGLLLAFDQVTDPGNVGAILRTAECMGAVGVILPKHRNAHLSPTVTKAAAGAIEHLDFAVVGGLPTAIAELKKEFVTVVGLEARADFEVDTVPLGDATCLVIGAEDKGLSRLVRDRCDALARIPMAGTLDSLNASAAAAIAIYQTSQRLRQQSQ